MRDINLLHPELQPKVKKLIELVKQKLNLEIIITQTFRTKEEQNAIYAQGRTSPGVIVSNVNYPNSHHNWGIAFDIAVLLNEKITWNTEYYKKIVPLGQSLGLEAGGAWVNFVDFPHYQLPGYSINSLLAKYVTPSNFIKSWTNVIINENKEDKNVPGFEKEAVVKFEGMELKGGLLEGKTYVELRVLAEALGLLVGWDNINKVATLTKK